MRVFCIVKSRNFKKGAQIRIDVFTFNIHRNKQYFLNFHELFKITYLKSSIKIAYKLRQDHKILFFFLKMIKIYKLQEYVENM